MNDQIREQLIGYVLGALDEGEHRFVEQQLERDPVWQKELESVQQCLEPLADGYEEFEPPDDLVNKTCTFVAHESERLQVVRPLPRDAILEGGFETRWRWRLADWIVVGGICLTAAALFFPALLNSRLTARIAACQNNLRELGLALTQFSEATQERFFPAAATEGNRAFAGVYASVLLDAGLLPDSRLVLCPESPQAAELKQFTVPRLAAIDSACGDELLIMQRTAGGTYAYTLGYISDGKYMPARHLGRSYYVIMADAPMLDWSRGSVHGRGVNVLYDDMHVQFVANHQDLKALDDPFSNRFRRCEAGADIDDAVVGPSYFPPVLTEASYRIRR